MEEDEDQRCMDGKARRKQGMKNFWGKNARTSL